MEGTLDYHLYPPFFIIEPQVSFGKAWEDFCRQLLCLEYRTRAIQACTPPDHGVDILWDTAAIAYQCKAAEDGKASSMNLKKIEQSIQTALTYRSMLGWQRYVLCTNVDLTGPQRLRLKALLPEIEFMGRGTWVDLCKKFPSMVTDRFRILIQVSQKRSLQALNEAYLRDHLRNILTTPPSDLVTLLVYSQRRQYVFELPVPSVCSVQDVLSMLRELFNLPPPEYTDQHIITIDYTLRIDDQEVPLQKKLSDLVQHDRPIVTLWKTLVWYKSPYREEISELEHINPFAGTWRAADDPLLIEPARRMVFLYEQKVEDAFTQAILHLEKEQAM